MAQHSIWIRHRAGRVSDARQKLTKSTSCCVATVMVATTCKAAELGLFNRIHQVAWAPMCTRKGFLGPRVSAPPPPGCSAVLPDKRTDHYRSRHASEWPARI